ncbi:putative MFS family arabinose efflux permease [Actinoplanes xinjiangensis]|uniref:Putative MFS family arabinose efflux permease n=1 Tax=Actinoplanes xinjiangensis TaxID=512350 RepID=A0A316FJ65_9ACTN|nr:putative MFS family arabinose efflux permease [Actinoplanes xinjiangensis]
MTVKRNLWHVADYRNLFLSHTVSLVGTNISILAFPLIALLLLDASATEVSLLAAVEFLPSLLLGLPAGAWVERLPRRAVLIVSDVGRAVAMATIPVAYVLDVLNLPLLFVVAFVIGLGTLFFDVAQMSYLPALIAEEELADGNGKMEGARSFAQLAGPSAGGFLVQLFTAPLAIALDVLTYVASAIFLFRVRGRETAAEPIERMTLRKEIAEGVRFVFGHPLVRPLALCALAADLAFAAVLALQVPYASSTLHLSPGAIGVALAVGSAGGLLGAVLSSPLAERIGSGRAVIVSVVVFSVGAAMVPLATGIAGFTAGLFVVYLGVVVFNVLQMTICQTVTPDRLLGRMNATLRFLSWGAVPVGAAVGGLLVVPLGIRAVLWIAAGVCALAVLPLLFSKIRTGSADVEPQPQDEPGEPALLDAKE